MAVDIKHKFVSAVPDSGDPTIVQSTDWNDGHDLTLGGEKLLGRYSAGNGAAQEISLGDGLEFSGTELEISAATEARLAKADSAVQPESLGTAAAINIFTSTAEPTPSDGADGDIWLKY